MPRLKQATKAEREQTLADRDWWKKLEAPLGLRLHGWTYRTGATFFKVDHGGVTNITIDVPGWLAERAIASLER